MGEISRFRGDIFNLGGGAANSLSLREATHLLESKLGHGTDITVEDSVRTGDLPIYFTDNRKSIRQLKWQPRVSLDQGFDKILAWIGTNEDALRKRYT